MCFFCGNDFSRQQYDRNSYLLKEQIFDLENTNSHLEKANAELNIQINNKKSEIDNLNLKLRELNKFEEVEEKETHSGLEFLVELLHKLPSEVQSTEVTELKDKIGKFLNDKIKPEVGFLKRYNLVKLRDCFYIDIAYDINEYDKKDLIVFRDLMMKTINNEELWSEMGWIRNRSVGIDIFISRKEVGFNIIFDKEDNYYSLNHNAFEYAYALSYSRYLIE
ncbi:hypothetical protein [Photobacterium leiognathi]|uniref:hypothetical protein n=1 Tax=Photobacterium leiognathi TaxID=553611 RepID=UPI0029811514|nr:hypothetical protein [Photobacterium leiognathi]